MYAITKELEKDPFGAGKKITNRITIKNEN